MRHLIEDIFKPIWTIEEFFWNYKNHKDETKIQVKLRDDFEIIPIKRKGKKKEYLLKNEEKCTDLRFQVNIFFFRFKAGFGLSHYGWEFNIIKAVI